MISRCHNRLAAILLAVWLLGANQPGTAAEVKVAVASSFRPVLTPLQDLLEQEHRLKISSAASGILLAQILSGAPFEVFISADKRYIDAAVKAGLTAETPPFCFAYGLLALASTSPLPPQATLPELLQRQRIAIPNPDIAPYGVAARQLLTRLELWEIPGQKLIRGLNAAQTFQFLHTGNTPVALVALAQAMTLAPEFYLTIPENLYDPVLMYAVVLGAAHNNAAASALVSILKSPEAQAILQTSGYVPAAENCSD